MESKGSSVTAFSAEPLTDKTKRVLIDARKLGDGGIGVYTENAIRGLMLSKEISLSLIIRPQHKDQFVWTNSLECFEESAKSYSLSEYFGLAKRIPFDRFDLFHSPHYTLPRAIKTPAIVTIHDLIHLQYPEHWYYPMVAKRLIRGAMARAQRVLTVSEASAGALRAFAPQYAHKVRVTPNALNSELLQELDVAPILAKLGVRAPYLLTVCSNLKPHKGLKDLLAAFSKIKVEYPEASLVLVGQGIKSDIASDGIIELSAQSSTNLAALYRGAKALVVPSLVEGFCLPALEARALGAVVVARPVPALREILSATDIVCEDFSVEALVQGLRQVLSQNSKTQQNKVVELTSIHERYSRLKQAENLVQLYTEVINAEGR